MYYFTLKYIIISISVLLTYLPASHPNLELYLRAKNCLSFIPSNFQTTCVSAGAWLQFIVLIHSKDKPLMSSSSYICLVYLQLLTFEDVSFLFEDYAHSSYCTYSEITLQWTHNGWVCSLHRRSEGLLKDALNFCVKNLCQWVRASYSQ